jgi:chloramphenicol 3-O phosphotransferase
LTGTSTIILLNGVGSAGKSSIARALQEITTEPFLHFSMDVFLEMLPPRYFDHPDGLVFETIQEGGYPSVVIHEGEVSRRALAGMRRAAAAMAEAGNNLIIDDVMIGAGSASADYSRLLAPYRLHWVGVHCTLDVLEAREAQRADRLPGLARWQFPRVHAGMAYDFEVDTSRLTPAEVAQAIKYRFAL